MAIISVNSFITLLICGISLLLQLITIISVNSLIHHIVYLLYKPSSPCDHYYLCELTHHIVNLWYEHAFFRWWLLFLLFHSSVTLLICDINILLTMTIISVNSLINHIAYLWYKSSLCDDYYLCELTHHIAICDISLLHVNSLISHIVYLWYE